MDHSETSYHLYDGWGSVTANTWQNGMVTSVYQYDPYGQVTLGSTEHTDFYGYNAESYNPNTGLEYLRARYYNADKGRFFQEDTYLGDITDPLTLNRYTYVKNSPLNYTDPSGHINIPALIGGAFAGAIGGAASSFLLQIIFSGEVSYKDLASDAISGAIIGGAEGAFAGVRMPGWLKAIVKVGDGLSTLLSYIVKTIINGEKLDIKTMFAQFIFGQVSGKFMTKIGADVDTYDKAKDIYESIKYLRVDRKNVQDVVLSRAYRSNIDSYVWQIRDNAFEWAVSAAKFIGISISVEALMNSAVVKDITKSLADAMDEVLGLLQIELCSFLSKNKR